MCYAIIEIFGCTCESCAELIISTKEFRGHGPTSTFVAGSVEEVAGRVFSIAEAPFELGLSRGHEAEQEALGKAAEFCRKLDVD